LLGGRGDRALFGPACSAVQLAVAEMFVFFSNRIGMVGSLLISLLLSIVPLYACRHA